MNVKGLYEEILLIVDTCEAMSLFDQVDAPNIFMVGTSIHGQHALSHLTDGSLNTYLNDKFSYFFYQFLKQQSDQLQRNKGSKVVGTRLSDF
jgi:phosphatidylinositol glycan class K